MKSGFRNRKPYFGFKADNRISGFWLSSLILRESLFPYLTWDILSHYMISHELLSYHISHESVFYHAISNMNQTLLSHYLTWDILSYYISHEISYHAISHMSHYRIETYLTWVIILSYHISQESFPYHTISCMILLHHAISRMSLAYLIMPYLTW